ncbi:MAG: hypothetical protein QOJ58_5082, partial [Alphaproteobacteria bacterium]|nr:hypothetical protein [Alphaproteobacteria bacterium]
VLVAAAVFLAVLHFYGGGTGRDRAELDVVRTAGTLVVGIGGFIALLLTARRQRYTELTLEHQREVAAVTERDAAEQRITELYTRAVDQLGNEKAPVRLGGLHALERLAQKNLDQQQTIVDVICAYLRMPYTPPEDQPPAEDAPAEVRTCYENRRQELQVRLTAQRILGAHLRPEAEDAFWPGIDLNLTQAYLHTLDLSSCHVGTAQFEGAQFAGDADFTEARFRGSARFTGAHFRGASVFERAHFYDAARFDGEAHFDGHVQFSGAHFHGSAWFDDARFKGGHAAFNGAHFDGGAVFIKARFKACLGGYAKFDWAHFSGADASFYRAQFGNVTTFFDAQFSVYAGFNGARVRPHFGDSWPAGWTTRHARPAEDEKEGWMYLVRGEDRGEQQPDQGDRSDSEAGTSRTSGLFNLKSWVRWRPR